MHVCTYDTHIHPTPCTTSFHVLHVSIIHALYHPPSSLVHQYNRPAIRIRIDSSPAPLSRSSPSRITQIEASIIQPRITPPHTTTYTHTHTQTLTHTHTHIHTHLHLQPHHSLYRASSILLVHLVVVPPPRENPWSRRRGRDRDNDRDRDRERRGRRRRRRRRRGRLRCRDVYDYDSQCNVNIGIA